MIENLKQYIFTTQGRLNRLTYLKYSVAFGVLMFLINLGVLTLAMIISGSDTNFFVKAVSFLLTLFGIAGYMALIIRRLHDLNRSDIWVVGIVTPVVNFILSLYLLLAPGTYGRNRYGDEPR